MPASTRDIKRRIKSVANTRKITKAMELVAASKMRRAIERVLASRSYSDLAWKTVQQLVEHTDTAGHPLLKQREIKRVAVLVIGSNRGLCGGFNLQTMSRVKQLVEKSGWSNQDVNIDYVSFGKKALHELTISGRTVAADFIKDDTTDEVADIVQLSNLLIQGYAAGQYDEIVVAYTHFHSSLKQEARIRHLLPVNRPSRYLGHVDKEQENKVNTVIYSEYIFEPNKDQVLESLLPRLVEVQLYQMVLESEASEHSARMLAMRNASDAANDMINDLTLAFNQLRQAGITQELAEISAGAQAMN